MTTGPTDGNVTTPAGGPGGMPLALASNEGLDLAARERRMDRLISGLRWWARNWPAWPWLDRKMGVGPGFGLTLLAVGLALNLGPFLRLIPWVKQWLQVWGLAQ